MSANTGPLRDPQQRAERAARILDTTAELLLRHGRRKVSIDDVAAGAGIGKGTVYLHWKSREQLFGAVFAREVLHAIGDLRKQLEQEPATCLLHRFARAYFLAITDRPLLQGLLLGDPELLGRLSAAPDTAREDRHTATSRGYVGLLAEHGLLRGDLTVDEVAFAYQAVFEGFLRAEGDRAERADLLARTVRRAFEDGEASGDVLREVAAATAAMLGELMEADRVEAVLPGGRRDDL
ncbi:TetR/AcrR family transcriptional regulator [Streptacidiphilus griseoplanus]|uniref:TetR/AcrR family transcriptional regulator n=1 Tax=Peterkaempfera griseoplana TaxID=66896 RepID=UPI0006E3FDA1|nr:TetR/AcrR family transcriptional regulator [Peterkaempfera griseoplana]